MYCNYRYRYMFLNLCIYVSFTNFIYMILCIVILILPYLKSLCVQSHQWMGLGSILMNYIISYYYYYYCMSTFQFNSWSSSKSSKLSNGWRWGWSWPSGWWLDEDVWGKLGHVSSKWGSTVRFTELGEDV